MENPFKNFGGKDILYVAGAVASLVALAFVFGRNKVALPSGTQSDTPNQDLGYDTSTGGGQAGYTNYNMAPINPTPLLSVPPGDTAAGNEGCCCPSAYGCAGPSQLDTGTAQDTGSGGLQSLIDYYQSINPNYIQAQQNQLNTYANYFATGQTYSAGAVTVPASNL